MTCAARQTLKGAVRGIAPFCSKPLSGPLSGFLSLGTPHRRKFLKRLLNAFKGGLWGVLGAAFDGH